ncbi:HK97-gp10 family putative phage morphogenesis protein [Nocardiopsis salina]|uniref:HK97-gp10 family putative phage morphogenesis protein n=1 Tax=Nocardiopsis salina TaxID=245836 RepID=UPI00034C421E|nr:HK97-gp10 family putative phage morphogenesis protein [Nocardiopsis salina]
MGKARMNVQLEGLDGLRAQLGQLPDQVRQGAADAVQESAKSVEGMMKNFVPVDSGTLEESIGSDVDREALTADIGTQGSGVHYGAFVEFGTSKMPAQPFAQPAAELERDYFPTRLRQHVGDQLPGS